jgi:hypothetical protein
MYVYAQAVEAAASTVFMGLATGLCVTIFQKVKWFSISAFDIVLSVT